MSVTSSPFETGVTVGDVFDIGYNVSTYLPVGELDLLHTAVIGFDLLGGVYLKPWHTPTAHAPVASIPRVLGKPSGNPRCFRGATGRGRA